MRRNVFHIALGLGALLFSSERAVGAPSDEAAIKALDTQYQRAVFENDAAAMDKILADGFVLVTGNGKSFKKTDLLEDARSKGTTYEHNETLQQHVRLYGDTAVITALLWEKGSYQGGSFDHHLWFSDVYMRTPGGWRYVFGQASLPLPKST